MGLGGTRGADAGVGIHLLMIEQHRVGALLGMALPRRVVEWGWAGGLRPGWGLGMGWVGVRCSDGNGAAD